MRYLQSFNASGDVQTALDNGLLGKPYVAYIESDGAIDWNTKNPPIPYDQQYLTFDILSAGTINWKSSNTAITKTISYSTDNGSNWTDITSTTEGVSFNVSAGDKVMFKGDNDAYASSSSNHNAFGGTAKFIVYGNIMSLIDSTGFTTATTLTSAYTFYGLFQGCTGLTSTENLVLPATTLANGCYYKMFNGCTSLTTAPELPATTLAEFCYNQMFRGCSSLTKAPELPATKLIIQCYYSMFYGCGSLNYIKCLATNISAYESTVFMSKGVSSSGTFVKNASMTSWTTGNDGIPSGWTVQDA